MRWKPRICARKRERVREKKKSKTYRVTGVAENNKIWDNRREYKARPHSLCTKCEGEAGCTSDIPVPINNRISRARQFVSRDTSTMTSLSTRYVRLTLWSHSLLQLANSWVKWAIRMSNMHMVLIKYYRIYDKDIYHKCHCLSVHQLTLVEKNSTLLVSFYLT